MLLNVILSIFVSILRSGIKGLLGLNEVWGGCVLTLMIECKCGIKFSK